MWLKKKRISEEEQEMKRFWMVGLLLCAVLVMSTGVQAANAVSGKLTVAGSTSVYPFMELLANAYMQKYPKVQINVQGGGSGVGIKAAVSGTADIGMSSRELKDSEVKEGLVPTEICRDGIAVILHPANPVKDMTIEQLKGIFAGQTADWGALGFKGKITVINREEGSGTRGAFEELVMGGVPLTKDSVVQASTGAVRSAVAADPQAIGYISMAQVDKTVRAAKVHGVLPNVKDILNGTYKIQRPFLLVSKGKPQGLAKNFIAFILSREGQKILAAEGLVVK